MSATYSTDRMIYTAQIRWIFAVNQMKLYSTDWMDFYSTDWIDLYNTDWNGWIFTEEYRKYGWVLVKGRKVIHIDV